MNKHNTILKIICLIIIFTISSLSLIYFPKKTNKGNLTQIIDRLPNFLEPDELDEVQPLGGIGPSGEIPKRTSDVLALLTADDVRRIRSGGFRVVICMQDVANEWSRLQVMGIRTVLQEFGVEVYAVTDGEFDLAKQLADYKNAIALKPDAIITIPLHTDKTAPVLFQAVKKGIKLVFMDTVPKNFQHPRDFSGLVIADSYTNGQIAAEMIAERLGGKGKVAMFHWRNKIFTCDERSRAARETFSRFPEITVVAEEYFDGVYDIPQLTEKLLYQYPDLNGLWVVWDTPAMEAVRVIKEMNKEVVVATVDLGHEVARAIAAEDLVVGTGAQHPFDQGVAEALITVVALAGKTPPAIVMVPGEKVTFRTIRQAWKRVYHTEIPEDINKLIKN